MKIMHLYKNEKRNERSHQNDLAYTYVVWIHADRLPLLFAFDFALHAHHLPIHYNDGVCDGQQRRR